MGHQYPEGLLVRYQSPSGECESRGVAKARITSERKDTYRGVVEVMYWTSSLIHYRYITLLYRCLLAVVSETSPVGELTLDSVKLVACTLEESSFPLVWCLYTL